MRAKICIIFIILILLSGCKAKSKMLPLDFNEVNKVEISDLYLDIPDQIIREVRIQDSISAFLFKDKESNQINAGININNGYFNIGEISMDNVTEDLMGIDEVEVLGKKSIKIYGVLGANYRKSFYWFYEDDPKNLIIQVDGSSTEIDLDNDSKKEIISTVGTIPETKIYRLEGDEILFTDINQSIGAKSVVLKDRDRKIFEIYFEANKPEVYVYSNNSLKAN